MGEKLIFTLRFLPLKELQQSQEENQILFPHEILNFPSFPVGPVQMGSFYVISDIKY